LTPVIILNNSPEICCALPIAGRRHVELARIGLGVGDELRNRLGWNRQVHLHDIRRAVGACDWRNIAKEIEIELVVERRIGRVRCSHQEECVPIRGRPDHHLGADIAACTRSVVDDEWLAEPLR
jgi:hypothetical protein